MIKDYIGCGADDFDDWGPAPRPQRQTAPKTPSPAPAPPQENGLSTVLTIRAPKVKFGPRK